MPDIPADVEKCLLAKPKAEAGTADARVKALWASDQAKVKCARTLFKWHREMQKKQAAIVLPEGHPKTPDKKAKPAATWE